MVSVFFFQTFNGLHLWEAHITEPEKYELPHLRSGRHPWNITFEMTFSEGTNKVKQLHKIWTAVYEVVRMQRSHKKRAAFINFSTEPCDLKVVWFRRSSDFVWSAVCPSWIRTDSIPDVPGLDASVVMTLDENRHRQMWCRCCAS